MADYSFTPQFANLAGLQPLPAIDVTRGAALQFQPLQAIQVASAQPELVGQGIANAIQSIGSGVLGGITAKYEEGKALEKEEREHERQMELYGAKKRSENKEFFERQRAAFIAENSQKIDFPEKLASFDKAYSGFVDRTPDVAPKKTTPAPETIVEPELPADQPLTADFVTPPAEISQEGFSFGFTVPPRGELKALEPVAPEVTTKPLGEIAIPAPAITKPTATTVPSTTSAIAGIPQQPEDPTQQRNLPAGEFKDISTASQVASQISTPYWSVVAKTNPRTGGVYLEQEDTSSKVLEQKAKQTDILSKEQEAEQQLLEATKVKAKEDSAYRENLKSTIRTNSPKLSTIDDAINLIEQNPSIVGAASQYLTGERQVFGMSVPPVGPTAEIVQKAADIRAQLESIRANIEWAGFQELKKLSPSGSAGVGALTEGERQSLGRLEGSLDPNLSAERLLSNLYNLRNAAVKTLVNAGNELSQVETDFEKPIVPSLRINPNVLNKIDSLEQELDSATPEQQKSREYKIRFEEYKNLLKEIERINNYNARFLGQQ